MTESKKDYMVVEFRKVMKDEGRNLKWFHTKYVEPEIPALSYSNFIRKMNMPDEMTVRLKVVIQNFLDNA